MAKKKLRKANSALENLPYQVTSGLLDLLFNIGIKVWDTSEDEEHVMPFLVRMYLLDP